MQQNRCGSRGHSNWTEWIKVRVVDEFQEVRRRSGDGMVTDRCKGLAFTVTEELQGESDLS